MHYRNAYTLVFLAFLFFFAMAQTLLLVQANTEEGGAATSILLSAALCVLVLLHPSKDPDILAPPRLMAGLFLAFFPAFALFYLYVPGLGKWYLQYFPSTGFAHNVALATCATVAALPPFLGGYLFGEAAAVRADMGHDARTMRPTRTGVLLMVLLSALGFAGMYAYARSIGGVGAVVDQMESIYSRRTWREVSSQYYYLGMVLMTAPPVLALLAIRLRAGLARIGAAGLLMILSSGFLIVTQASREKAVFPLILFLLTLFVLSRGSGFRGRRFLPHVLALTVGLALVAVFFAQTMFRAGAEDTGLQLLRTISEFNRLDVSMVMFGDYFNDASGNGYLLGLPILAYPERVLVRLFDFDPIMNTSEILHQFIFSGDQNAGNPGAPMVGELYLNFGWFGYAAFALFGYLFGRLHGRLFRSGFAFWPSIFYATSLYFFMFKLCIYTGLSESVLMLMLVYFPLLLWRRLLRFRL